MNLFDVLNNISNGKTQLDQEEDFEKAYSPYMINRFLAMSTDTVFFGNEMSKNNHLPKRLQYLFHYHGINKKKRFFSYAKNTTFSKNSKNISKYYKISLDRAVEFENLLNKEQIKEINKYFEMKERGV